MVRSVVPKTVPEVPIEMTRSPEVTPSPSAAAALSPGPGPHEDSVRAVPGGLGGGEDPGKDDRRGGSPVPVYVR
jgi:hypothetical protein